MIRKSSIATLAILAVWSLAGCPGTDNGGVVGGGTPIDPDPGGAGGNPSLSISASDNILGLVNDGGRNVSQLASSTTLRAIIANSTGIPTVFWEFTNPAVANPLLQLSSSQGSEVTVAVIANSTAAAGDYSIGVRASSIVDDFALEAFVTILVQVRTAIQNVGNSSVPVVTPTATPPFGADAMSLVQLQANAAGPFIGGLPTDARVQWTALRRDPRVTQGGVEANLFTGNNATLTVAPGTVGVFPFQVTADDSDRGGSNFATGIVAIMPGYSEIPVHLDVQLRASGIGSLTLQTRRSGGTPGGSFAYAWEVRDSSDNVLPATFNPASGSSSTAEVNDWTVTGFSGTGVVRFICTVTDSARGNSLTATTHVAVGAGMGLTLTPMNSRVQAGRATALRSIRTGGVSPFTYALSAFNTLSPNTPVGAIFVPSSGSQSDSATIDWAVSGISVPGTFRFDLTVTDGSGTSDVASTIIEYGDPLLLDVQAGQSQIGTSPVARLINNFVRTRHRGGIGAINIGDDSFSASRVSAAGVLDSRADTDFEFAVGSMSVVGGETVIDWNVTVVGNLPPGTYRLFCQIDDDVDIVAIDSTEILIADELSVTVESNRAQIPLTFTPDTRLLRTRVLGGITEGSAPYPATAYAWVVVNPAGANETVAGTDTAATTDFEIVENSIAATTVPDQLRDWRIQLPTALVSGTYRFFCTVSDAIGNRVVASTSVFIGDALDLDVTAAPQYAHPGVPVRLRIFPTGGAGDVDGDGTSTDYTFNPPTGIDPFGGGVPASAFGTVIATVPGGTFSEVGTVTFSPPLDASGTYRLTVSVTDGLGVTVFEQAQVYVSDSWTDIAADRIINLRTSQLNLLTDPADGVFEAPRFITTGPENAPDGGSGAVAYSFSPTNRLAPSGRARSVTFRIADANTINLSVTAAQFVGRNQRGEVVTDVLVAANLADGTTRDGTVPFLTLDRVTLTYENWENQDSIEIGCGSWVGLSRPYPNDSASHTQLAFQRAAAAGDINVLDSHDFLFANIPNDFEARTFVGPDIEGISFEEGGAPVAAPNGARDYVLQYQVRGGMEVVVSADRYLLDSSANDEAMLFIDIAGGVPPYDIRYVDMGSINNEEVGASDFAVDNNVDGNFTPGNQLAVNFASAVRYIAPAGVTDAVFGEIHTIRVEVIDATSTVAAGTVAIHIIP